MKTYTKSLEERDYSELWNEMWRMNLILRRMEKDGLELASQHPHRQWEYGMALNLIGHRRTEILDVGAGESYFSAVAACGWQHEVCEVEPHEKYTDGKLERVNRWLTGMGCQKEVLIQQIHGGIENLSARECKALCCFSVMEHLEPELEKKAWSILAERVAVGGVLFITVDVMPNDKTHVMDHLRKQNFQISHIRQRAEALQEQGMEFIGEPDWTYHGDMVYDYSFFSVGMKRIS